MDIVRRKLMLVTIGTLIYNELILNTVLLIITFLGLYS